VSGEREIARSEEVSKNVDVAAAALTALAVLSSSCCWDMKSMVSSLEDANAEITLSRGKIWS